MYPSIKLPWLYEGASISLYFLAIAAGFLCAAVLAGRQARRLGIDPNQYQDFAIWMLILGVLGARLMHVLVDGFLMDYVHLCLDPMQLEGNPLSSLEPCASNQQCLSEQQAGRDLGAVCAPRDGLCYPQRDCLRWLKFWAGGLTVYGSLIACTSFAYVYIRRRGWGFARLADIAAPGVFFGIAVGRLGCLAAGCCFGQVCDIEGLGVRFPTSSLAYQDHLHDHYPALLAQWQGGVRASLPVWPTQLISSAYNFGIFAFGYFVLRPRKRFHGQVILTSAILYGICRFLIEFVRADFRGGALWFSTSQWVSLPVLLVSVYLLWTMWRRAIDRARAAERATVEPEEA